MIKPENQLAIEIEHALSKANLTHTEKGQNLILIANVMQEDNLLQQARDEYQAMTEKVGVMCLSSTMEETIDFIETTLAKVKKLITQTNEVEKIDLVEHGKSILMAARDNVEIAAHKIFYLPNHKFFELASNNFQDGYYMIAAEAGVGKTAWLVCIGLDVLLNNPDTQVLFYSLDDDKKTVFARFVAALSYRRNPSKPIAINRYQKIYYDADQEANRIGAIMEITELCAKKKLDIMQKDECPSLIEIDMDIKSKLYRYSKTVVLIDSVLSSNTPKMAAGFEQNEYRADKVKDISIRYGIPVFVTNEINKPKDGKDRKEVDSDDIKGTGRFSYHAKLIILAYPVDRKAYKKKDNMAVNIFIEKNKFSEHTRLLKYDMHPAQSTMIAQDNYIDEYGINKDNSEKDLED